MEKLQAGKSFWTKKLSLEENVLHKMEETKRYIGTLRNYGVTKAITDSYHSMTFSKRYQMLRKVIVNKSNI